MKAFASKEDTYEQGWRTTDFVAEMDRRYEVYKSGNATLTTLDEVESKARAAAAKVKTKKAS